MKPKIVIILGPTAVGKSALALELAGQLNGEIVNADSQQVYRYLDIGTGKPTMAERERVRHHLIDVVNPDQEFNAAMFRHLASEVIYQIDERKRTRDCLRRYGTLSQGVDARIVRGRRRRMGNFAATWKRKSQRAA